MKTVERERILLVDDSRETLEFVGRILAGAGYAVTPVGGAVAALERLATHRYELVVTDLKMPGVSGMELLREVRERHPECEIMMITGYATIEGAVEAVKSGAQEYLAKPFTQDELLGAVRRALARLRASRAERPDGLRFGLAGRSAGMRRAFEALERAATGRGALLLVGEPGTGRSTAAHAVARARGVSPDRIVRAGARDVLALGRDLPGADGALCLHELEWAGPDALARISELVEGPGAVFLCAGERLERLVSLGVVRGDLHAKLAPTAAALPPLRERGEDVEQLARLFLSRLEGRLGSSAAGLEPEALAALRAYPWPGNVPELRDAVLEAALAARGAAIALAHLPGRIARAPGEPLARTLADVEAEHIRAMLGYAEGRKGRAAEILGIDRKTLREKLRAMGEDAGEDA